MDIKKSKTTPHPSSTSHRTVQKSTTLNRKFVKKPTAARIIKASEKTMSDTARRVALAAQMNRQRLSAIRHKSPSTQPTPAQKPPQKPAERPTQKTTPTQRPDTPPPPLAEPTASTRRTTPPPPRLLSARELKDRAIARALASADTIDQGSATLIERQMDGSVHATKFFWQRKKFILALSLSVISVAFLGFIVYQNLPEIISRVTAASSGIETSDPAFIPKDYYRDSIVSEQSGKVVLSYTNAKTDHYFTITEQRSSWNSAALLSNFVVPTWGEDYFKETEQGLTIYVHDGNAAWVSGGIFYLIESPAGTLATTDLHNIAISI